MQLVKFKIEKHMSDLLSMLRSREAYLPGEDEMPATGFIVYDDQTPVAAAFLRRVEGGYAQVDGLTSNPHCSKERRHKALNLTIQRCVEAAEAMGVKHIISFCLDNSTTRRAELNGFEKQPHTVVTLTIKAKV